MLTTALTRICGSNDWEIYVLQWIIITVDSAHSTQHTAPEKVTPSKVSAMVVWSLREKSIQQCARLSSSMNPASEEKLFTANVAAS